jgi:ubiquinone/menaquinone biosynthesis C-methylase UbiE
MNDAVDFHDSISATWADRYDKPSFQAREALIGQLMKAHVKEGQRWLDLGCGTGRFLSRFLEAGAQVVGIDGSRKMLWEAAKRNSPDEGIALAQGDANAIPLVAEKLDGVLCVSLLEYLDDSAAGLAEIARVMAPNATLIIVVPNSDSLQRRLLGLVHRYSGKPAWYGLSRFEENESGYRRLLADTGLNLHTVEIFGGRVAKWQSSRRVGTLFALVAVKVTSVAIPKVRLP